MRQVYGSEDGTVYEDDGEDLVGVKRWWASANKIKGDW